MGASMSFFMVPMFVSFGMTKPHAQRADFSSGGVDACALALKNASENRSPSPFVDYEVTSCARLPSNRAMPVFKSNVID